MMVKIQQYLWGFEMQWGGGKILHVSYGENLQLIENISFKIYIKLKGHYFLRIFNLFKKFWQKY